MDIVFVDTSEASSSADLWHTSRHHDQLLTILQQASVRAAQLGSPVLASFIQPITLHNPLQIFSALHQLQAGKLFFWEQPAQQNAFVGLGIATSIESNGPECFEEVVSGWHALQQTAIIGYMHDPAREQSDPVGDPILFGGFAFDPLTVRTSLWEGFPDGLLLLPELLFCCHDNQSMLTINKIVQASDDVERFAAEVTSTLQRLHAATEHVSEPITSEHDESSSQVTIESLLPPSEWKRKVASMVQEIREGRYEKGVLARGIRITNNEPFDITTVLSRLRTNYPGATTFALQRGERFFAAATPERLIRVQEGKLQTMALAGSYPRGATEEEDERLANELLNSEKNKGEHSIVAETIRENLADLCSKVWVADAPRVLRLKNIQHLATAITGELKPGHGILEALRSLHPTPAVGGFPREIAMKAIRELEDLDRGWYVGAVGWTDLNGNGDFFVALRSGLIDGNQATLIAGNGIVADSEPESELTEVSWKLQVMLNGLGIEHADLPGQQTGQENNQHGR